MAQKHLYYLSFHRSYSFDSNYTMFSLISSALCFTKELSPSGSRGRRKITKLICPCISRLLWLANREIKKEYAKSRARGVAGVRLCIQALRNDPNGVRTDLLCTLVCPNLKFINIIIKNSSLLGKLEALSMETWGIRLGRGWRKRVLKEMTGKWSIAGLETWCKRNPHKSTKMTLAKTPNTVDS